MHLMKRIISLYVILFFTVSSVIAQKTVVRGQVTTFNFIRVEQAEVIDNKSKTKVHTDSLGFFTIECDLKGKLSIKAAGFKTKKVKVRTLKESEKVNIEIAGSESDVDLAVAEGHINKNQSSEAKKLFNTKKPFSFGFNNMTDLIRAKFPQLNFTGDEIIMRGSNSLNGRNGALIVLNGTTYNWGSVKNLEVTNIKNIQILTGTAASRYGTGSSNGVILIQLISE